jgi:hypothetical protein
MTKRTQTDFDALRLERLVDGELPPDEYRALLASLDDEPGGWRRCALAFLEAQTLASELGSVRGSLDLRNDADGSAVPPRRSIWRELPTLLAMAASFLVVFSLGIFAPRFFQRGPQEPPLAGNLTTQTPELPDIAVGGNGTRHQTFRPIGNLRLVMDGASDDATQAGQVPVYEVRPDLDQFFDSERPVLTPELVDLLRERGYDVRHEHQYFPAPLDDGRQIIVPVDGYQITPVNKSY